MVISLSSSPNPPSSPDSLFSELSSSSPSPKAAQRTCPPISGLYIFPSLLPYDLAGDVLYDIGDANLFSGGALNQVMLFQHAHPDTPSTHSTRTPFPQPVTSLLSSLSSLLVDLIPADLYGLCFSQPLARQVILNMYSPGDGIAPHVDLPRRYADGIVGCSLVGGCVMRLDKSPVDGYEEEGAKDGEVYDIYLPPRTVYILSGEARWGWKHGIQGRLDDVVERERDGAGKETLVRDLRVSVTFRWMQEGADVLS